MEIYIYCWSCFVYFFFLVLVFVDSDGAVGDRLLCVTVLHGLTRFGGVIISSVLSEVEGVVLVEEWTNGAKSERKMVMKACTRPDVLVCVRLLLLLASFLVSPRIRPCAVCLVMLLLISWKRTAGEATAKQQSTSLEGLSPFARIFHGVVLLGAVIRASVKTKSQDVNDGLENRETWRYLRHVFEVKE